jgi:hypothetical protein
MVSNNAQRVSKSLV